MPPDHIPSRPVRTVRLKGPEASIPRQAWAKPCEQRDQQVNMQLGGVITALFAAVVLVLRPEAGEVALAVVPFLVLALRRSYVRYRHISVT
jgi:hypothetical protein